MSGFYDLDCKCVLPFANYVVVVVVLVLKVWKCEGHLWMVKETTVYKCIFVKAIFMISMFNCQSYIKSGDNCNSMFKPYFWQCHVRKDTSYASFIIYF